MQQGHPISVAMCTFNGERFLREQLNSIAAQTITPHEIVICDDGSTDRTVAIVSEFSRAVRFDVKLVHNQVNLGPARNFEQAIGLCSGELIALADQDDVWYPNKLERLAAQLIIDPQLGGVFCDADLIDEHSIRRGERLWQVFGFGQREQQIVERGEGTRLLCVREVVTGASMMLRASLRPVLLPIGDGWMHDAWMAWMLVLYSRLGFVPECLMGYRVHSRQQAGIPPRTVRQRLANLRRNHADLCSEKARRFEVLARCTEGTDMSTETLEDIRHVIDLCRLRANLPEGRLQRIRRVLSRIPWYLRYTNGLRIAARDVILKAKAGGDETQIRRQI
ncbi:MAG TPA: glycosyltransferase family 2 protein [Terriglobales bacterium]|nr:glycosyltransferase family 2 protein [Terriglobales bacterium]